eukprot:gene12716-biopygen12499
MISPLRVSEKNTLVRRLVLFRSPYFRRLPARHSLRQLKASGAADGGARGDGWLFSVVLRAAALGSPSSARARAHVRPPLRPRGAVTSHPQSRRAADADRTRTGRGAHNSIQRNRRGPDADTAVSPSAPSSADGRALPERAARAGAAGMGGGPRRAGDAGRAARGPVAGEPGDAAVACGDGHDDARQPRGARLVP